MKKSVYALVLFCTAFFLTGCSELFQNSYNEENEVLVLRLANNHVKDFPTSQACDYFAELVNERTDGKIKILCYHEAILGDESSTLKQLKLGGIDFVRASASTIANFDSSLNVLSLPYIYQDNEHMWKVLESQTGDYFLNGTELMKNNMIGICWYTAGSRNFYSTKPLDEGLKSLEGLKIRTQESPLLMDTVSAMNAQPVPMPFSDVYASLLTGEVDAAENNIPSYISTQHYKIAKYMITNEHSAIPEMIVASKNTIDNLNHDYQEIIKQCAEESTKKQIELWNEYEQKCIETAISEGCTIIIPTEEQKNEFRNAVQPVKDKYSKGYEDLLKRIEN